MHMLQSSAAITAALLLGTVTSARADEATPPAAPAAAATPLNYVVASATTTLFYKPNSGDASGWQHDIGPVVGFGRYVTDTIALELDLGPGFVRGDYVNFVLVPGAVWSFSTHVYAAGRFLVQVDPELNLALFPGVGGIYTFDKISLTLELNVVSYIGRGKPDLGITLTPGIVYSF